MFDLLYSPVLMKGSVGIEKNVQNADDVSELGLFFKFQTEAGSTTDVAPLVTLAIRDGTQSIVSMSVYASGTDIQSHAGR